MSSLSPSYVQIERSPTHYVTQALRDVYTREGAEIWLHGRKRSLAGRRPVDMLAEGSYEEILDAIERKRAGAM